MKKLMKKIVGGLLIGTMLLGCGDTTRPNNDVDANVDINQDDNNQNNEDIQKPDKDNQVDDTDKNNPDKEDPNKNNANQEDPNKGNSSVGEGLEIQLPNKGELLADYTTVKDLQLEAGSHIAVVVKSKNLGYWETVKKGMQQAIDELNKAMGYEGNDKIYMTYESPKSENSVDEQVNILDSVVSENPDVICLAAVDMDSCMAQIEAAKQNGIPVIILDSGLTQEDLVYSNCSTDNYSAGKEAAKRLCELIGDEGEIAVLAHLELSETSASRVSGFKDEIEANHQNVRIVNISYDEDDVSLLKEKMRAVLTLNPELDGYFCTNQVVSEIALQVLAESKYENLKLTIVGFDMGEKQMKAIREGKLSGTVCQNPYGMGYVTVVAGVRAIMGLENDKFIDAGFQWIDQTTIDIEDNKLYLYE